jgi:hypothetical protein
MLSEVRAVAGADCTLHIASRVDQEQTDLSQAVSAQLARHLLDRVKPDCSNRLVESVKYSFSIYLSPFF